jgi:hypothetical protein
MEIVSTALLSRLEDHAPKSWYVEMCRLEELERLAQRARTMDWNSLLSSLGGVDCRIERASRSLPEKR